MNQAEIDEELGQPGAQKLLESATLARLAYNGHDGFPRAIPLAFFWDGSEIVLATAETAPKVAALAARPQVALTIDAGDTSGDSRALLIRGTAEIEVVDGVPDEYVAAAGKALSAEQADEFAQQVRAFYPRMARIAITPAWARYFEFGGGRVPRFLAELAGGAA